MRETGLVTTYIGFLRAVNVGGRQVKMDRLRTCLTTAGFENVRTYIASGNVFLDAAPRSHRTLRARLEEAMEAEFGFAIPAMVRTTGEVQSALARRPFDSVAVDANTRLVVLFMGGPIKVATLPQLNDRGDIEIVDATATELFVVMRIMGGRVPNPAAVLQKQFGVESTARFFHTTQKILDAAKAG